ncbi:MAG: selenocysteine-specific translation elongation factor, partial [Actinomycetota bacterium]|nr:selenocysteine-specific translation elongation factor [Actinomycetota bacterium]
MPVIGTAGHVDHGKSTLVKALTGIDPDRLEEEKRRGLTIDLGFAWFTTSSGEHVGIVDVPGHERFIKNMLAGAGGIHVTLFCVAANEGWKPQSQEHLDIMDLLGVSAAIVVITKVETVEDRQIEALKRTIENKIIGTTLQGSPIIGVSALTGQGIDDLVEQIEGLLARAPAVEDKGRMRLWIDRVFTIKGSGTVVTGTLAGSSIHTDQEVEILPGGQRARVRAIQSHNRELLFLSPGNRTALNLVGVEQDALSRGDVLTTPGAWRTTDRFLASLRFLPQLAHEPQARGAYKVHVGSGEIDAKLVFIGGTPEAGESGFATIRLSRPTVLDFHDRFILRDAGRRQTVAGGVVLEAHPVALPANDPATLRRLEARLDASGRLAYLQLLLGEEGFLSVRELTVRTGLKPEEVEGDVVILPGFILSGKAFRDFTEKVVGLARAHQSAHPLDAGLPLTALRPALGLPAPLLDEILSDLHRREIIRADSNAIRTPDFSPQVEGP